MNPDSDPYNIAAIRNLLKDAFTADTLWRFCQERADFRPILLEIGRNAGLSEMIDKLLEHCQTQLLFDRLLADVQEVNPAQYERHIARLQAGKSELLPISAIPHNLPPRSEFVGREAKKARIHKALQSRPNLGSIDGMGGIGKTALALEVAHECLAASRAEESMPGLAKFAGFAWITAKDSEVALSDVFDTVARTLGYPGITEKNMPEKWHAICHLLQGKRYLLILDNLVLLGFNKPLVRQQGPCLCMSI